MNQKEKAKQIKFLQTEISQLRFEIEELKQLNFMNKQVIEYFTKKNQDNTLFSKVMKKIYQQFNKQSKKINELISEKQQMSGKILVLEKMMEQIQQNQRHSFENIREQINQLKIYIEQKQLKIRGYQQKIGEVDYLAGFVTKYVNITTPNQQSFKFDEEIKNLNLLISFQNESIQKLKQEKQNLIKINMALKSEIDKKIQDIQKIKESSILITNGNNQTDQSFDHSQNRINFSTYMNQNTDRFKETSFSFLKFQRNIVDQESDSDFDPQNLCPELSVLFPDKIQKIIKKRQSAIPKLNMQKVRTLMKKNRNKIDVQLKKNIHVNPTEKIITLQNELEFTRRELSKSILECKNLSEIKRKNEVYISEIEERNETLVSGYKKLKDNWHKLSKQYFSYRRLYEQCQKIIKSEIKLDSLDNQFNPNLTDFMQNLSQINTDKKLENMEQYLTTFLKKIYSLNQQKKIQKCKSQKII